MDPNAPLTTQQFTQAIGAAVISFAAPWVLILPTVWLVMRWWDRRALRKAQARWQAWEAAHPCEPRDEVLRRWQLRQQLWLDSQPAYIQAHLLRQQLAEAEREAQVEALLEAERQGRVNGEG
jgi:hypothetical protein